MKFSNFVSTLAVVCLAFNADALSIQTEATHNVWYDVMRARTKYSTYSDERAFAACKYVIDKSIGPEWKLAKKKITAYKFCR